jgi:hypothetical protein
VTVEVHGEERNGSIAVCKPGQMALGLVNERFPPGLGPRQVGFRLLTGSGGHGWAPIAAYSTRETLPMCGSANDEPNIPLWIPAITLDNDFMS